jgi:hypothetical protein
MSLLEIYRFKFNLTVQGHLFLALYVRIDYEITWTRAQITAWIKGGKGTRN